MSGLINRMKVSKSAKVKEEECGVWLDTKELKDKKQKKSVFLQRQLTRAQPVNCNLARQSNISSFFPHKPRDSIRCATHTGSTHTGVTHTHTGAKRKHSVTAETPQDADGPSAMEQHFLRLIYGDEPPDKRRAVVPHTDHNVSQTQEHRNTHPHRAPPFLPTPKNKSKPDPGGQRSVLSSNGNHRARETPESPGRRGGKENRSPVPHPPPPSSPSQRLPISSPSHSRSTGRHGGTLALFTQDSEGLCVIAHRERDRLSAVRESYWENPCDTGVGEEEEEEEEEKKKEEEEEEEEMLFTQDSEGNMVIKH